MEVNPKERIKNGESVKSEVMVSEKQRILSWSKVKNLIPFAALLLLVGFFSVVAPDRFATYGNVSTVLQQAAVTAIVGLGMTFVIVAGSIDLSVGSVVALTGIVAAKVAQNFNWWGVIAGLVIGGIIGLLNGLTFTILRIPSFITTLGMLTIARGLTIIISHGSPIIVLGSFEIVGRYPLIVYVVLVVFALCYVIYNYTTFGRYCQAIGGDERVAVLSGVPVLREKIGVFTLGGILAGLGGVVLAARVGAATPTAGQGFELDVISAVVLGGTPLTGGVGTIQGTLVGALLISMLTNGLVIMGIRSDIQMVIRGMILILAVFISLEREKIGIIK